MKTLNHMMSNHTPWNKDKLTGQKPALKLKEIWSIRTRLQISHNIPELALFNMALIHFVEQKSPLSTDKQKILELFNCYWGTQRLKALYAIWDLRWMMHWRCQSIWMSKLFFYSGPVQI